MSDHVFDPGAQTSAAVNRRAFVGLAGGAAGVLAGGSSIAAALAQGTDLGKPHPPIVAETDPAIAIERVTLERPGIALPAYVASPKNATARTPGIVVTQAIWGVDAQLRDVVRRFAKEGYVTIAPELYARNTVPNGDNATDIAPFRDAAAKLDDATVDGDLQAAATWIRRRGNIAATTRPPKIAVLGFCMGGSITLRQAVDSKSVFDAASVFYGKVRYSTSNNNAGPITPIALAYTDEIAMPLIGSWGQRDTSILADDVRAMQRRLKVPNDIRIYDEAGHAFFDDTRSSYVPSAAADAWTRNLAFFSRHLAP